MAKRRVRLWPDPALSEVAQPVTQVDAATRTLVGDLFDTMYAAHGIGLAANQVGVAQRVLVVDLDPDDQARRDATVRAELASWNFTGPAAFINPEIVASAGSIVWEEGCLSVPGVVDGVKRRAEVTVRALDRRGVPFTLHASGLYAVAIQHEIDHLDGKVFVDYLSRLKRDVIRRKMNRLRAEQDGGAAAVR